MLKKLSIPLAIALIILGSLLLAIVADTVLSLIEKEQSPTNYEEYVQKYASEYNIPEYIIFAVIKVESDFDPNAVSSMGAIGLMQMMPKTFKWLTSSEHLSEYLPVSSLYTPDVSIRYGCYYLRYLFKKFHNWNTVFAAYNGGEGNVTKWLSDSKYSDGNGNLTDIPNKETKNYVKKVNEALKFYKDTYYKSEVSVK